MQVIKDGKCFKIWLDSGIFPKLGWREIKQWLSKVFAMLGLLCIRLYFFVVLKAGNVKSHLKTSWCFMQLEFTNSELAMSSLDSIERLSGVEDLWKSVSLSYTTSCKNLKVTQHLGYTKLRL